MKKTFAFISGVVFTAALIITCGGGGKVPAPDSGTGAQYSPDTGFSNSGSPETGLLDGFVPRDLGVGDVMAQGQPATVTNWSYGYIDGVALIKFVGTPAVDCSSCVQGNLAGFMCCANIAGASGWELIAMPTAGTGFTAYVIFKRSK
jgi:hypothetical protein